MANKRVISVNESSLVDLKAELYRKETQFKREKVDSSFPKKTPIWQKKKKDSKKKKTEILKKSTDENTYDKELEKSRLMLETKSALYEKLSKGEIEVPSDEDDQDGRFLVDFHKKAIAEENEDINDTVAETLPQVVDPDEEWVDYVDTFGRSRKCLRKDLPTMKEKDGISKENDKKSEPRQDTSFPTLLSDDMRRELIRKKWEKEMEETLDKPVGPIHYQDVLFEETRDHGVGFYKFSKAEEERQKEQTLLKKLRTQTEQQRDKREKVLEKRKVAIDARLAKVKERKLRRLKEQGLVTDDQEQTAMNEKTIELEQEETSPSMQGENEISVGDMVERIRNKSTRIEKANIWEKNKIDLMLFDKPKPKAPTYDPQSERDPDFAPPSFYTKTENKTFKRKSKWGHAMDEEEHGDHRTACERTESWGSQNRLETEMKSSCNSYPQEPLILPNAPQVSVDPYLAQPPTHAFQPPTHAFQPPSNFPPPPPPPPHAFPPSPTSLGSIPPNLPLPPTHAFPPPPSSLGSMPPNLPPPPTHTFLIPPLFSPLYPPPQFPTIPCNNNSGANTPYQPPGTEQYTPTHSLLTE